MHINLPRQLHTPQNCVKIDNILLEKFAKISILYSSQNGRKTMMNWLRFLLMGMVAYAAFSVATARSEEVTEPYLEGLKIEKFLDVYDLAEIDEFCGRSVRMWA